MDAVLSVLYVVVLVTAGMAGAGLLRARPPAPARRAPVATMVAFALTAVPSLLQLTVAPGLFEALRRDRAAIGDGQLWRLVTSFAVQDGGWPGLIFNLAALAVIGTLAERLWGPARWVCVALAVQVLGNLWGLVVQPVGAGTSLVNYGLAASLAAAALVLAASRPPAVVSLAFALVLLALGDIHGGAALLGGVSGGVFAALDAVTGRKSGGGPPVS
ncbi:rhomboid family intramembrane serine protease [Dactylosporangium sp. NBC_01737]|uniref:rhomboid family intramembrane serine protease n=1 Tax=Dactylosporangium sp. NBC_01737 TaxID=2975959 RepID=UPI002E110E53|nr:rhomboid family intramembrane serine protease [Dactylosporangium sp. NBC_01737]